MENSKQTAFGYGFTTADGSSHVEEKGLTKREHFAGLAMQGLLANQTVRDILSGNNGMQVPDLIAEYSLQYADALLAKLSIEDGQ